MNVTALRDFWIDELKDLYNAESQIVKALPKMVKSAGNADLQQAFEHHLEQTHGHVERLERILDRMGSVVKGKKCKGMEGLLEEGKELMSESLDEPTLDVALIAAAQKVEHYEIAAYGTARTHAEVLGESEAADLLEQTLEEEKETDEKLNRLAEHINREAVEHGEDGEDVQRDSRAERTAKQVGTRR